MIKLKHALLACMAFALASCYETKQEITLNPDGTGKMRLDSRFQNVNIMNDDELPEDAMQAAVARIINDSKGIEVWDEVSFEPLDDGRIHFMGTAYFKKIDAVEIQNLSLFEYRWTPEAPDKATLSLKMKPSDQPAEKKEQPELNAEQTAKKIKEERAKFQQSKPMLTAMVGNLKQSVDFRLPGKVVAHSNFKKRPQGTLGITFEGSRMIEAIEQLMADDAWLGEHGFDAMKTPQMDDQLSGLLFGEKAPISASVAGANQPLFDYAAETAAAKKNVAALQKKLGVTSVAAPAEGGQIQSIQVVGARIAQKIDKKLDLRAFHQEPGYSLSVLVQFSGSVLNITDKSRIESATASDGSSLLRGNEDWDRRLDSSQLSADKASAVFEIRLKLPPAGVQGVKEISGIVQYRVSTMTQETDLGELDLKSGSKSSELGGTIEEIKDGWKEGTKEMGLKLKLDSSDLKAVFLVRDGDKTELERIGHSGNKNSTVFRFLIAGELPEKASLIVQTFDGIKTFDVPFTLENLTLLGERIAPGA